MTRAAAVARNHSEAATIMEGVVRPVDSSEYKLRKQLLLLASLVVGMTYAAGLNPPGGAMQEDGPGGVKAGEPILKLTHHLRYHGFYYCNATSLGASLVVIFLLLLKDPKPVQLAVLRLVMVLDLFGLMGAYLAGSCHERPATVYAGALVVAISAYVGVGILQAFAQAKEAATVAGPPAVGGDGGDVVVPGVLRLSERRKVLLVLATFTVPITYVTGLNPPGGFWGTPSSSSSGRYRLGDSLVEGNDGGHFKMFFYCNTTAFLMSLFTVVLLLGKKLSTTARSFALIVFVLDALVCLVASYASGSCRDTACTVYVISLFAVVMAFIFVVMLAITCLMRNNAHNHTTSGAAADDDGEFHKATKKVKSLVLLLANLVVTITYQAGLGPPGGFWPDNHHRDGHIIMAGDSILMSKHPVRYKAFFYCNSFAFVVSMVAILMVQNVRLSRALLAAMTLDMFALIGAYTAGSCRDMTTTVVVLAMAGGVLAYVVIHVLFAKHAAGMDGTMLEKLHKRLLLLSILVATITYQAGLAPPAGFRVDNNDRAGDAVLLYSYPRRYETFFYCNTASFMSSMALILLLVNPNLSDLTIRCYALYACQVAGLLGLMGAYAAGSAQMVRTSIFIFVLVLIAAVVAFVVVQIFFSYYWRDSPPAVEEEPAATARSIQDTEYREQVYGRRKYLMTLGILAASVTYQAGMAPPGGLWQDDHGPRQKAGCSVLQDTDPRRYRIFFFSNSTSFIASVVVIALLLQQILRTHIEQSNRLLLLATNTAVVLDLLGLLAAYAAGSTREWENVAGLALLVGLLMAIHAAIWLFGEKRCTGEQEVGNGNGESS